MSRNIFSISSLRMWLERQPADQSYDYTKARECLMTRYFEENGVKREGAFTYGPINIEYPGDWKEVAQGRPRTYGHAAARAKKIEKEI